MWTAEAWLAKIWGPKAESKRIVIRFSQRGPNYAPDVANHNKCYLDYATNVSDALLSSK